MVWANEEVGTVAELAKRVGSRRKAERLLKKLAVPVVEGAFSRRLFVSRLENPGADSPPPAFAVLRASLRSFGIDAADWQEGRPTTVQLRAMGAPVELGFQHEENDEEFRALKITGQTTLGRVYSAKARTGGNAYFSPSGFRGASTPPVYLFVLISEKRVWTANRTELAHFEESMSRGSRSPPYFGRHSREGALRLAFPQALIDWDLAMRARPAG